MGIEGDVAFLRVVEAECALVARARARVYVYVSTVNHGGERTPTLAFNKAKPES